MNMGASRSSVFKVNALGYWKLDEEPLDFDFDEENKKVNVNVKGTRLAATTSSSAPGTRSSTVSLPRRSSTPATSSVGATLGVSVQIGRRSDLYTLSYTEPYFLDRRILLGGSIFKTNQEVADYYRETKGSTSRSGKAPGLR